MHWNSPVLRIAGIAVIAVALISAGGAAFWLRFAGKDKGSEGSGAQDNAVKLVGTDSLDLPEETVKKMGVKVAPAEKSTQPRPLELAGSLGLDTNLLARVRSRFPGEVMQIGDVPDETVTGPTKFRPLDFGDKVEKGQLLAVVWSKDLGEKKSELVGAIAQRHLHEETLKRLEKFPESVSERAIREAKIAVEADTIAVERARRTLRSWLLTDEEIKAIEDEAERIWERRGKRVPREEKDWARVEVRAPFNGVILERNIAPRDIVDTSADLFRIADLTQLRVWANIYEEDLPAVQALNLPFPWKIHLKADPKREVEGKVEKIGEIVDPNDHTARLMGRVPNPEGRMKAGQFITATIDLPAPPDEVFVPASALVEDGRTSIVFVQEDPGKPLYTMRRVVVGRRLADGVGIRSRLSSAEEQKGLKPLRPGERVVTRGSVELKKALADLQSGPGQS